jgi:hypothetical protein
MRAGYIWLVAGLITAAPLSAQTKTHWGLLGGVALAEFGGADAGANSSRAGVVAGGFVRIQPNEILVIEPELLFVQKGAETDASSPFSGNIRLDYLEVPLLVKANFPVASDNRIVPSIFAGPAVAFKLGCNLTASSGSASASESCSDAGLDINGTDFSFVLGAGADIGSFLFQLRYDIGLSKVGGGDNPADVKNKAWLFTVGYRF